ncbi:MAG: diguanylate cyclase response regulator [Planctomycetes bacterium]|nr:diguanylate cyclase response regulator [Planctomycetota bacterium]
MTHATTIRTSKLKVLLIEDNPGDVFLLRDILGEEGNAQFNLVEVDRLADAHELLEGQLFDVVLLDLSLPDSRGLETLARVHEAAPQLPIVVLTALDDESQAIQAVQWGAQDYLVKGQVNRPLLHRALRYAIERNRLQAAIRSLTLVDPLTGLYNRRGFLTLAEQYLKLAHRTNRGLWLLFADMDGLKGINDTYGHHEGDLAIMKTSEILRQTFRESDIIARLGGDEFTVLAIDDGQGGSDAIVSRLHEKLDEQNGRDARPYRLSLSLGIAHLHPEQKVTLEHLLAKADKALYEHKKNKS